MKRYIAVLCVSLVLVMGFGFSFTLIFPNDSENIVYTATVSQNKEIQQRLKTLSYYKGAIDGIIGPQSLKAIKAFQKDNGLVVDGIVGNKTSAALKISSPTQNSGDLNLLAKCVYAEARGEPYQGQVAVAAVVLNRVRSASFPNSISGVIYQPWAFTCVNDGQINLSPNQSAYNAARDAMNGWDPSYGSIYYYNPKTATSKWIYSRQTTVKIGKHVFAK